MLTYDEKEVQTIQLFTFRKNRGAVDAIITNQRLIIHGKYHRFVRGGFGNTKAATSFELDKIDGITVSCTEIKFFIFLIFGILFGLFSILMIAVIAHAGEIDTPFVILPILWLLFGIIFIILYFVIRIKTASIMINAQKLDYIDIASFKQLNSLIDLVNDAKKNLVSDQSNNQ